MGKSCALDTAADLNPNLGGEFEGFLGDSSSGRAANYLFCDRGDRLVFREYKCTAPAPAVVHCDTLLRDGLMPNYFVLEDPI